MADASNGLPLSQETVDRIIQLRLDGIGVQAIADKLHLNVSSVKKYLKRANMTRPASDSPVVSPKYTKPADYELISLHRQVSELKALNKVLQSDAYNLESIKRIIHECGTPPMPPRWVQNPTTGRNTGVPTLVCSDWHWDEVVEPSQVNGVNAFNREIAIRRARTCFEKTVELLIHHMANPDYDYFVLDLGGDMLAGNIHEELRETNESPISQSVLSVMDHLIAGIDLLLESFTKIQINCVPGNHGRWDKKPRFKNRVFETYEWLMYQFMKRHYKSDDRVCFNISDGADLPYKIHNTSYLLTHGDQFKGGSGIAGALCLPPDTPVLLSTLDYAELGDIKIGDELVGFDEVARRRRFKGSVVTGCDRRVLECLEIETEDGLKTVASLEHPWLTRSCSAHSWSRTENLHIGSKILTLGPPWSVKDSWEYGYLSGVLDGEGCIEVGLHNCRIAFAQQNNACLKKSLEILDKLGIPHRQTSTTPKQYEPCYQVRLFGGEGTSTYSVLRLLGEMGPRRLLQEKGRRVWDNRGVQIAQSVKVVGLRYVGKKEVVTLSTSTSTFIANGMLTHNSPLLLGDARKRKRAMATQQPFDYLVMGHWHQLMMVKGIIVNSSLKGYDEFAFQNNFDFELPSQALWITHPVWGITARWPVYLEKLGTKF